MIDTLEAKKTLLAGGASDELAEAIVKVQKDGKGGLVTKDFLKAELAPLKSDLANLTKVVWGFGSALVLNAILMWIFKR